MKIYIAAPLFAEGDREWQLKPVNYNFSHMFTFVKGRAQMLNMPRRRGVPGTDLNPLIWCIR